MPHLINLLPILFIICSAATFIFVIVFLVYSIFVSDSGFAERRTSIVLFRLLIASALAALAIGIASLLLLPIENRSVPSLSRHTLLVPPGAFGGSA
jgi:hypothetical protein